MNDGGATYQARSDHPAGRTPDEKNRAGRCTPGFAELGHLASGTPSRPTWLASPVDRARRRLFLAMESGAREGLSMLPAEIAALDQLASPEAGEAAREILAYLVELAIRHDDLPAATKHLADLDRRS